MIESVAELQQLSEHQINELACVTARELTEHPGPESYERGVCLFVNQAQRLSDDALGTLWTAIMSTPEAAQASVA